MNIIEGFPIAIYHHLFGCSLNDLNKKLLDDIFIEISDPNIKIERTGGKEIVQTAPLLETKYESFQQLSNHIVQVTYPFFKKIGILETSIGAVDFWANVNESVSGFHMPHSHTGSGHSGKIIYTGVYFPTTGFINNNEIEEKFNQPVIKSESNPSDSSLVLLDPLEFVKTTTITNRVLRYPYFGNPICFQPQKSLLVMFPNYLPHMTIPNKNNSFKRISIAFNILIKQ
jgi:hypothetical protein